MIDLAAFPGSGFLGYLLPFLAVLTVVVFFHELGHFLVARWAGVRVEAFSVGFGPELLGFTDAKGTRWKISAIPLGGYVRFFGDANAASMPDAGAIAGMSAAERAVSFPHKSVARRAAIVAAGPIANFLLAIAIFSVSFMTIGRPIADPVVSSVQPGSAAEAAGFQAGDVVRFIDGARIESFTDIPRLVAPSPGREMLFAIDRGGVPLEIRVTPKRQSRTDRFGNTHEIGIVRLMNDSKAANLRTVRSGPLEALLLGVKETWFVISQTLSSLRDIFLGYQSADQLGGPIRIAKVSGDVATLGLGALVGLTALISVSIGLLNLFPIPMLDGGHLVFYALEAIRGRPVGEWGQEIGFRFGLAVLLGLMLLATWNDVTQLFF